MAKLEKQLAGDFSHFLSYINRGILDRSVSASFEDGSDWQDENVRVSTRVYERYSYLGSNRVSLSLTVVGWENKLFVSAITSGGSQAVFFKINTWGENSFLSKLSSLLENYRP